MTSRYQADNNPAVVDQTIITGGAPSIYVDSNAPNTTVQGFHFKTGSKSIQFFAQGGRCLDNFFDHTGSDAISFEDVGGVVRGNHVVRPGDDGIDVDNARGNVTIENNTIELARDDGIEIRNQNYTGALVTLTIRDNTILNSAEDGIQLIDYAGNSSRKFVVEGNLVRTSVGAALGLMDNGETIEDFRAASMPERILVFSNTFDRNPYGISGGDNLIAVNNIITNCSVLGIKNIDGGSNVSHTLFFGNAADAVGSNLDAATAVKADPLYASDYGLQAGSPAIDAGTASFVHNGEQVLNIPSSDWKGAAPDLGWKESLFTPSPPPLFTAADDTVDFQAVVAGKYLAGSQYDALAGKDNVTLPADSAAATAAGFDASQWFHGGDGADSISGGALDEKLSGDAGIDILHGGDGNDSLKWDNADTFDGGTAFDTLDTNLASGDTIDLRSSGFKNLERVLTGDGKDGVTVSLDKVLADTADHQFVADVGADTDTLLIDLNGGWTATAPNAALGPTGTAAGIDVSGLTAYTFTKGADNVTIFSNAETAQTQNGSLPPLFTNGDDTLDFSKVVAGTYLPGSQYDAGGGNDAVTLPAAAAAATAAGFDATQTFHGGAGADAITGGTLADTIAGDAGNDNLKDGSGNDKLSGGDDDDLLAGGSGNDALDGGNGTDTANFGTATAAVTANLAVGTATGEGTDTLTGIENVIGSAKNDTITGNTLANVLQGGSGNDNIKAGDENDTLTGGSGKDTLNGDVGDDTLAGGDDNDALVGGTGIDKLSGDAGHDSLQWDSSDSFDAGIGFDTLNANLTTADMIDLRGAAFANLERIQAGGGNDTVTLSLNDVRAETADGQFVADLGSGTDTLNINIDGGWADVAPNSTIGPVGSSAGISVTGMTARTFSNRIDTVTVFSNAENVQQTTTSTAAPLFTVGNDIIDFGRVINGTYLPGSQYSALAGNDTVTLPIDGAAAGAAGYSAIRTFDGGDGNDLVTGGGLNDIVSGGNGTDTLIGGNGSDTLNGGGNGDTLKGGPGDDVLDGAGSTDTVDYSTASAAVTLDLIAGTATGEGTDTLRNFEKVVGSGFDDNIAGNIGANVLTGGGGNDVVHGGDGNDTLTGGTGTDKLAGDAGHDVLKWDSADQFDGGAGFDTLDANLSSADKIDLRGANFTGVERILTGSGKDTVTLSLSDVLIDTADKQFVADLGSGSPDTLSIDLAGGWSVAPQNATLGGTATAAGISVSGMTVHTFSNGVDNVTIFTNAETVNALVLS